MSKFSRWLRSKTGTQTIIGVVAVLVIVAIVGQVLGWWAGLIDLITGTVVSPPVATYPAPQGGYTCLPTCADGITDYDGDGQPDPQDGKFFSLPGEMMASFGGETTVLFVSVPAQYAAFEIGIFDGDSGKDTSGNLNNPWQGNWDNTTAKTMYTLYADPLKDGSGTQMIGQWSSDAMPNNDWYTLDAENASQARGQSGHYFYRLEATRPVEGIGINAFKVRSNAYLSTGRADMTNTQFAIVGMLATMNDVSILYPEFEGDFRDLGLSTYTGEWHFYFYVPEEAVTLDIWDGDFDRGTSATKDADTDDFNTVGKPDWASPFAVSERGGGRGNPADDWGSALYRREPPVWYEFVDPDGMPVYTNDEPSGTEEWERYTISLDPSLDPDLLVEHIKPGFYTLRIEGLDVHNTVWLRIEQEIVPICEDGPCTPPPVCDATCPRTIGYWKNNVKKVLIDGKTRGVQETPESIEAALRNIALKSPLFRHGIDVQNPQPIDDPTPLTAEEAHMILQRDHKSYPGGKDAANSMLARALQQDLASWLNWGSGKICDNTILTLNVTDGFFEGTLWEALQEAQDIVLNGGNLERAKDIGDQINNGNLGEDAPEITECRVDVYEDTVPPDKQPPKYKDMPKAPKKPDKPQPTPVPMPDPETCEGVRVNRYNVEVTNNPFAGVKFEYQSGTEVKNGDFEEFRLVTTQEQAQALTSVQMEAKAGTNVGQVTLESCDFTSPLPCGSESTQDKNRFFAFTFLGAEDNGDGTLTLTFHVQNMTDAGLSHATIGIPEAQIAASYESKICP